MKLDICKEHNDIKTKKIRRPVDPDVVLYLDLSRGEDAILFFRCVLLEKHCRVHLP